VRVVRVLVWLEMGVDLQWLHQRFVVLMPVLFPRERLALAARALMLRWLLLLERDRR